MLAEARFLLGALVLHAVAIPTAYALAPVWQPAASSARARILPYEIDVDVNSALLPPQEAAPDPSLPYASDDSAPRPPPDQRAIDPNVPPTANTSQPDAPPPVDPGEVLTANPDAAGVDDEYYRPPSAADLHGRPGLPGVGPGNELWRRYPGAIPDVPRTALPAPTAAPEREYDRQAATRVLQDGVRQKEKELGLDFPGRGVIRNAFVGAVYSSDAPYVSNASFSLSVDKSGKITGVSLLGFSGGDAGTWKIVQQSAQGALSGARLTMKSAFSKGAVVGVSISSIIRTPTGGPERDGLTINFDPSDIGAKATRIVSAHVNPQPVR